MDTSLSERKKKSLMIPALEYPHAHTRIRTHTHTHTLAHTHTHARTGGRGGSRRRTHDLMDYHKPGL